MEVKKTALKLLAAAIVVAVLDFLLLVLFVCIGNEAGAVYGKERFNYRTTIGETLSIRWDANPEEDLAGYKLYRVEPGGDRVIFTAAREDTAARIRLDVDRYFEKIAVYLTAFDNSGNESFASDTIAQVYHAGTPVLYGDFDGSGAVDIVDLFLFYSREGARLEDADPFKFDERFDLWPDGALDIQDRFLLLKAGGAK